MRVTSQRSLVEEVLMGVRFRFVDLATIIRRFLFTGFILPLSVAVKVGGNLLVNHSNSKVWMV